jgi:hypothetical protein
MELMARTCKTERMNVERILARLLVILGGAFWVFMAMANTTSQKYANLIYNDVNIAKVLGSALVPLAVVVIIFVVGLFYEYLAAAILFAGAGLAIAYGLFMGWETGVWVSAGLVLIAPMVVAGLLYLLAARMQKVCELEGVSAT